jgi:hypothetical protein
MGSCGYTQEPRVLEAVDDALHCRRLLSFVAVQEHAEVDELHTYGIRSARTGNGRSKMAGGDRTGMKSPSLETPAATASWKTTIARRIGSSLCRMLYSETKNDGMRLNARLQYG